jgi:hypothetical protein
MPYLSFLRLPQGYSLMLNQPEGLPRVDQLVQAAFDDGQGSGLRALLPEEPGGGALLGVNEAGAAFALLSLSVDARLTRLIPAALGAATAGGGLERAAALGLGGLPPFVLAGFEPSHAPMSLAWDGQGLQRRLHPDGALALGLGPGADAARAAFDAVAAGLQGADEARALAAQEAHHLASAWGRHAQVLLLPRQILLRYIDAAAQAQALEPQAAWLPRGLQAPS